MNFVAAVLEKKPTIPAPAASSVFSASSSSVVIALLVATASIIGLVRRDVCYPNLDLRAAFVPNDAVNLLVGVPVLLVPAYLGKTTSGPALVGTLLCPGAFAYHLYSSLTYVLALWPPSVSVWPSCAVFFLHLSSVLLSAGALLRASRSVDGTAVGALLREGDSNAEPLNRFGGSVLVLWGSLFLLRAAGMLLRVDTLRPADRAEAAVCLADVAVGHLWIWCGWHLRRRSDIGGALGLGVLFQASALFAALEVILVLRPLLVPGTEFGASDVAAVGLMGLTVCVPFVRLLRFVATKGSRLMALKKAE